MQTVNRFRGEKPRHLTASILYGLGQHVGLIQAILRHKSPSTTERYLKSLGLEETRDALESLSVRRPGKVIEMRERPAENRAV